MFACEGGKENGVENPLRIKLDFFNFAEHNLSTCVKNCVVYKATSNFDPAFEIFSSFIGSRPENKTIVSHNHFHFHVDILHNVQKREENKGLYISGSVLKIGNRFFGSLYAFLDGRKLLLAAHNTVKPRKYETM